MGRLFTSESVTEGHPDKIADQISDALVDAILARNPDGRAACETLVTTGLALVAGEVGARDGMDVGQVERIVRETIVAAGYDNAEYGIDGNSCAVLSTLHGQSPELAEAVGKADDDDRELGAGDQGMMFGFACDETPERMPAPVAAAHALCKRLSEARRTSAIPWLRPDGKSMVTYEYGGRWKPERIGTVVLSAQHDPGIPLAEIRATLDREVVKPVLADERFRRHDRGGIGRHINPSGSFVLGGPHGDAGLTGRKIIVDTYGGRGRHGGGAFSGKDPSKVDRSGAYAARWAAKNLVEAGAASRCEVQVAYAIGVADPVQVAVNSFGTATGSLTDGALSDAVREVFDFRPKSIIRSLGLGGPVFGPTAAFGHFGRRPRAVSVHGREVGLFAWERTDRVDDLRTALNL